MSQATAEYITEEDASDKSINLLVDGMHCPSCVNIIEGALKKQPAVKNARLNLSTKRLKIIWHGDNDLADEWLTLINGMGYRAVPFDPATSETAEKKEEKFLLRCLAVAGFASGNLMIFSVPLWSSDVATMGEFTRTLFHWIQAIIAIPAIAYCGRPFYISAWKALKSGHTNMDVPISVAVILATMMSMYETITFGRHSYFDSGVMLLFFLLIGRYLEARARGRARSAAHDLLQMMTGNANIINADGRHEVISISAIAEGMVMIVAAGEKINADGEIIEGDSEIDTSLITGESMPRAAICGDNVFAGTINLAAPLKIKVTKTSEKSLISEIVKLMEKAEQSQARYVGLADRISGWYTPVVHALAAITFGGWIMFGGAEWQVALLYAATVLIITCPCALGLAVPVVQVLASSRLMRSGILLKSGSALERLASVSAAVFDKTGTLTIGKPELINRTQYDDKNIKIAASMAAHSRHPLAVALSAVYGDALLEIDVVEYQGSGLESVIDGKQARLGKAKWCGVEQNNSDNALEMWLVIEGQTPVRFAFADALRADSTDVVRSLGALGIKTSLLSGDRMAAVEDIAGKVGIKDFRSSLTPVEKSEIISAMKHAGDKVLMVGDGLNDAPSLAVADISMSPSSAIDITQNTADIVFQGKKLSPVVTAIKTAIFSQKLVRQNFALAMLYNVVAIPLAVFGMVTPLIAAIAMSSSSIIVILNAMRLLADSPAVHKTSKGV